MKKLGTLKNGIPVFNRENSHLHKGVEHLLPVIFQEMEFTKDFVIYTYDFGFPIGHTYCVMTDDNDEIYYKNRPYRKGLSKFVKNRKPELISRLTFIIKKADYGYICLTAFIGDRAEPETWDENAFLCDKRGYEIAKKASQDFWATHALIEEN